MYIYVYIYIYIYLSICIYNICNIYIYIYIYIRISADTCFVLPRTHQYSSSQQAENKWCHKSALSKLLSLADCVWRANKHKVCSHQCSPECSMNKLGACILYTRISLYIRRSLYEQDVGYKAINSDHSTILLYCKFQLPQ